MRALPAREAVDLSEIEARQIWSSAMDRGTDYSKFIGLYQKLIIGRVRTGAEWIACRDFGICNVIQTDRHLF